MSATHKSPPETRDPSRGLTPFAQALAALALLEQLREDEAAALRRTDRRRRVVLTAEFAKARASVRSYFEHRHVRFDEYGWVVLNEPIEALSFSRLIEDVLLAISRAERRISGAPHLNAISRMSLSDNTYDRLRGVLRPADDTTAARVWVCAGCSVDLVVEGEAPFTRHELNDLTSSPVRCGACGFTGTMRQRIAESAANSIRSSDVTPRAGAAK